MRVFRTKPFSRFASKAGLEDRILRNVIGDIERGLVDADRGGGILKQRVARDGAGKSGGFRTIIVFKRDEKAIFVHGFAKNDRDNIGADELAAFRKLAAALLAYDDAEIACAVSAGALTEIMDG